VPFAVAFDRTGDVAVVEAGPSVVATFRIGAGGGLTPIGQAATGQAASCWITAIDRHLFVSNAGSGTVSAYSGSLRPLGLTATDGGTVDSAATPDGRYLYVQTGAAGTVDEYRVGPHGSLTGVGSVTVPGAAGGEGIATS